MREELKPTSREGSAQKEVALFLVFVSALMIAVLLIGNLDGLFL